MQDRQSLVELRLMRNTPLAILLSLSLCLSLPALGESEIDPLLNSMLKAPKSGWARIVSERRSSLQRTQLEDPFLRALSLLKQDQVKQAWALAEAIDYIDWSLDSSQKYAAEAQLLLVRQLQQMAKNSLAQQYLKELVAVHPECPQAQCEAGKFYLLHGQVAQAEAPLRKAIDLAPTWAEGYLWLGEYALVRGDAEAAKALFKKTLELDPKNATAADALNGLQKPDAKPFSLNKQALGHFNKAETFFDAGKFSEAIEEYQLALDADPQMGKAQIYMGDAYLRMGKPEIAIDCYRKAIVIAPGDKQAYRFLGDVLESRFDAKGDVADLDEAIAAYQKAIEIDPSYKMARENLEKAVRKHK